MLTTILMLLASLLPSLLPMLGLSPSVSGLISAAATGIKSIIADVGAAKSGASVSADTTAALVVLQSAVAALRADTALDPTALATVNEQLLCLEEAISALQAAEITVDPTTLTPLPDVPGEANGTEDAQ